MNDEERYQLDYFITESRRPKRLLRRYRDILSICKELRQFLMTADSAADIGCGAYGGIFNAMRLPKMFGVDPLWDSYSIFPKPLGMVKVVGTFFSPNLPVKVDAIVTMDALNYCDDINRAAGTMKKNLKDHGVVFIHMNVRKKEQLNRWHKHLYKKEDIDTAFGSFFKKTWESFNEKDLLNDKKYPTYMELWQND